jgi:5'-methylthioadenosine phosphorylase
MVVGIIGGSGLYQLGTGAAETIKMETPFGTPSGPLYKTQIGGNTAYFLARHGEHHTLTPSEVNYRANIYALKKMGAKKVISVSAVGSLREPIVPGHLVLPDQYLDLTRGQRASTFFGGGVVAHAHFADPTCPSLREHIAGIARKLNVTCHLNGTYVCMEGPQFSTRSESHWYRSWDLPRPASVIGMTAIPEAKLAREAGLCYQTVAMATDYDCWNEGKGDVSLTEILAVLKQNVNVSRQLLSDLLSNPLPECTACHDEMKHAVVTPKEIWPEGRRAELEVILA